MRFQQNISSFDSGVVVIEAYDTTLPNLRRYLKELADAIAAVDPGTIAIITTV
jgi:hypothetical protein